jgi:CheY-like chemotaxis protein
MSKILHIEDESDIQQVARIALEDVGGFSVLVVSSGREGLAAARSSMPDLILLDVMMPGMDGPTTLKGLRECPGTKLISMWRWGPWGSSPSPSIR